MIELDVPKLETERLILRGFKESDIAAEAEFYASDRSEYVGGPMTAAQTWRSVAGMIGHWSLRGFGFFAVELKETGAYCGHVGPWCPADWPEPEIGWSMMNGFEGRGIAHEAALATRRWAYETLGWKTAISLIAAGNARSIALARKLGAVYESDFEHERYGTVPIYRHPDASVVLA